MTSHSRRGQPVEFYVFLLMPVLVWMALILDTTTVTIIGRGLRSQVAIALLFGARLLLIVPFLLGYICVKGWLIIAKSFGIVEPRTKERTPGRHIASYLASALYILISLGLVSVTLTFVTIRIGWGIPLARVVASSLTLRQWDEAMFGVFVPFWMQHVLVGSFVSQALVSIYKNIDLMYAGTFMLLAATNTRLWRSFVMSSMLVMVLGLPFWYGVPAVSPDEMYRQHLFLNSSAGDSFVVTPAVAAYATSLEGHWSRPDLGYTAVSTFPSMHVAWGLIIAYFVVRLWSPLGVVLIPWTTVNAISAVYTLQHYAVDAVSGVMVASLSIAIAEFLIRWSPVGTYHFMIIDLLQGDIKTLGCYFKKIIDFRRWGTVHSMSSRPDPPHGGRP